MWYKKYYVPLQKYFNINDNYGKGSVDYRSI